MDGCLASVLNWATFGSINTFVPSLSVLLVMNRKSLGIPHCLAGFPPCVKWCAVLWLCWSMVEPECQYRHFLVTADDRCFGQGKEYGIGDALFVSAIYRANNVYAVHLISYSSRPSHHITATSALKSFKWCLCYLGFFWTRCLDFSLMQTFIV